MAWTDDLIQSGKTVVVFAVEESSVGTQAYPVATNVVVPSGAPEFNQQPSYTDSTEVRNSRSMQSRFPDVTPAGTWSFPMYARPSGTQGDVPDGAVLLKSALGLQTIHGTDSVTYEPASSDHVSLSVYFGMKDMVFALIGATVNEFKASVSNKGAVNFNFSGQFMQLLWAGKALTSSASGSTIQLSTVADAKKFRPGMKVKLWDDSDSDYVDGTTGYTLTVVNETTGELTITETISGYTWASGDGVEGFLPTATEVGDPIPARLGTAYLGGSAINIVSMDLTVTNNIKYQEDEITTDSFPQSYIADTRKIVASCNLFLRTTDLDYFRDGYTQTDVSSSTVVAMLAGDTDGSRLSISIPYAVGTVPAISGDLEKQLAVDFTALASAGEDEIKISFY